MKRNILFVVPTLVGGGAEKTVANLSRYLNKKYNIYIAVLEDTELKYNYSGKLLILTSKKKNRSIISKIKWKLNQTKELKEIKKKYEIDCSISFLLQADLINVLSKRKEKIIVSIRNKESVLCKTKLMKMIMKFDLKKADKVIAISEQVKDDIVKNFKINDEKITTIYNPCLLSEFSKTNKHIKKELFVEGKTVITMGRLVEQKGQWHLIRAFKQVVQAVPEARLIVLGEGELREYLENLVQMLNLEKNVYLIGFEDIPYEYIKNSDLFIFPSLFEGLGNSLLEVIACNIPIISSDCDCGPREILAPNTNYLDKVRDKIEYGEYGVLIPTCDGRKYNYNDKLTAEEEIMGRAIITLLNDEKLKEAYKEKMKLREKDFNVDNIVKQWENIIND